MVDVQGMVRFIRKPFEVEAIEITEENIEDLAAYIGELKRTDDNVFIQVDRRLVPNLYRVFPGFWMTRIDDHVRCYSARVFSEQFVPATEVVDQAVDRITGGY